MALLDEEERKKRYERARQLSNSINPSKTTNTNTLSSNFNNIVLHNYQGNTDEEKEYISRFQRARQLSNSINPREDVPAPSVSEEELQKGHQDVQSLLNLMDNNIETNTKRNEEEPTIQSQSESNPNANSRFRVNGTKTKEEIDQQIQQANSQNIQANTNNTNNAIVDNDVKIGLASQAETQNAQELTQTDIQAMSEANRKNENIEKGGLAKFEETLDTFFDNIIGGAKQTVSGLANVVTTGAALGLRGLEGVTGILGLENARKSLNNAYNSTVETGSNINEIANYERTVNSQVKDDLTRTVGDVTNVISNMISSQVIGYALPSNVPGVVIQGLSVGGNSAQEVLDENKDNIGQATLTGIAKGYTSYLTEKMFDANILTRGMSDGKKKSIQKAVDKLISDKIKSSFGKEAANRVVGIIGENAEELVEDNIDNIIDNVINNKETPKAFSKEWWTNTTDTAKVTTISTIVMSLLGLGGESFHDKEVDMEADYWIEQAQQFIEQEDMAIHFNPSEVKTMDDTKDFYITRFTPEGEIANIVSTRGKTIANPNQNLNVKPAIVRDNITNMYNVIDEDTGVVLDSTPYSTTMEAESGFDGKVNKLSDLQIRDINQKISNASYMVNNEFTRVINEAKNELSQMTPADYGVNTRQNTQQNQEQERQNFEKINKTISQISDRSVYNQTAVDDLLNTVSNNINNVEYVQEDNGGGILYSFDNDRNITGQQTINGKVYSGKKIKSIVNTAIQNADTTNLYQEANTDNTQTSSEPNESNFYSNSTNYAVQDINRVTEPFSKQESYSRDELAETWNDEVSGNNYDAYYDSNGNIERYIAIEEDGNNVVINQYDNNDNVVKSEVIPNENGRYRASDIQDTLNRVASLYDEDRPIKGQQDIEGNEVKSMKKKIDNKKDTKITKKIEEYIARNPNLETNINISTDIVDDINIKEIKQMEAYKTARDLFSQIHKRKFQNNNTKTNIYVTNSDIKESINTTYTYTEQRKYLKENIAIYSQLDNIIENAELISNTNELKGRQNYQLWEYYAMPINIDNNKFIVQFDTVQREDGETHFRVERLYKITEEGGSTTVVPTKKSATRFTVEPPSTNNSIPQSDQTVKANTNNNNEYESYLKSFDNIISESAKKGKNIEKKAKELATNLKNDYQNSIKGYIGKESFSRPEGETAFSKEHSSDFDTFYNNDNYKNLPIKQHITDGSNEAIITTTEQNGKIFIDELYVKNQNKGYGTKIIEGIKKYAKDRNLTIETSKELSTAREFWNKVLNRKSKNVVNSKNNTSNNKKQNNQTVKDDGVRAMKKNTSRSNTTQNNAAVDNQGRTLSKQQQEYFKNSKIRDSKGNLQTVYHTSKNDFTVFDPTKTEHYRFGKNNVNYYTDNKNMSLSYSLENPKLYEGYLNITNPYVINAQGAEWNKVNKTFDKTLIDKINKITPSLKQEIINKAQETSQAREKMWNDYQNEVDKIYSLKNKITPSDKFYRVDELENLINKKVSSQRTSDEKEYLTLRKRSEQLYSNYNIYDETVEFYKYFENNKEFDSVINSLSYKQKDELKTISRNEFYEIAKLGFNQENIADRFGYYETTNDIVFNVLEENKSRKQKYDGVIIKNVVDYGNYSTYDGEGDVFVTFNSNQFKNVDNTNPTSNQDIRFAKKSAKTPKVEGKILEPGQTNAQRESNYIEQEIRKIEESGNWDDSIPVTKMTDIRKTIENYLGLGVQKGHFRQQAYGIYKGNRDVIRTKELKDIDTILHETGHALDIGKRINLNKETISDELLKAVSNYGGYEAETREVQLEEGFAEVIREYTIVPNQARIDYPQTVSVLEGIRQADKEFNNFINTVQQQTYNYIHQNPRNRTLSNVSIGERTDQTKLTPAKIQQEVMRNIYDKDWTLKSAVNEMQKINGKSTRDLKASENAYYLTRLSSGIGDKVISMLSKGYIDENGNKLMPGLEQLGEILGNNEQRFNDLRAYLVAQRDLEYKAKTLKTGIRTMDSRAVVKQFKNDTQIQEAAKLVYDTLDGVMQYAVNNGLISQDTADSLRESNAFYVPMQRVLEGNKNNVGRKGAVADIIKARTGSELDVKDVLENIVANSANIIQQVENNNILKALYNQGEQAGMTGKIYDVIDAPMVKIGTAKLSTWERELRNQGVDTTELDLEKTIDLFAPNNKVDANNLITSFINTDGKRVYLQFNDEVLFNSLMNMDKKFMSTVLNINRKLNMPLRYGATMANIGFAIPNMISDTAQAAIFSEAGFIPVVDNVIGIMDILSAQNRTARNFFNKVVPGYADRINTLYAIYEQTGATSATRMSQYRERTQSLMKDVYGTKNSEVLGIKEKYKPLKRLLDIMTYIPELSEQSTRFRVFEKNLEYYRRTGMEETDARIQAALQSRDATQDFGRTGNITREINQLIPFSAARVGSAYTFAEKVKANPKRVVSRMAILMAISTAIKAIGYDDDEIEELNQRKKDDNFILKIGDQIVTIKKPQGILRSIVNLGEYVQDLFTGHIEEGKEGERLGEWLTNAIMDNMPADSVTGLVPNMIAPVVENAINKDLYYNSDIVKSYDLELPDSEQYYDYNSQLAIWLGQIFNYSPAKIDNLISGYFAGLGTSVTNVIDWIAGKIGITAEQPNMGAEDNAVGKRFIVNVNSNSQSVDDVYTLKTDLTKKQNGGTITEEEEKQLEAVTQATSNMAKLNKQIKEIKKSLTMSGEEKAEQIRILQQQKTDTARQALGKDLLYSSNTEAIQSTQFYPSRDTLSQNKRTLTLTSEMKKEYEEIASEYYQKYESQGLYSEEKLEKIKEKAKDYAKSYMMKKYKSKLVKSEK